jgi:hypothetical protein
MIEIVSYFKNGDLFIPCGDYTNAIKGDIDNEYEDFEGAIYFKINDKVLIDEAMWDYVDQLWRMLLDGLAYLKLRKHYIGYFPDQAIEVNFVDMNDVLAEIRIKNKVEVRAVVEKQVLFDSLLTSATDFFNQVKRLSPQAPLEADFSYIEAIHNSDIEFLSTNAP